MVILFYNVQVGRWLQQQHTYFWTQMAMVRDLQQGWPKASLIVKQVNSRAPQRGSGASKQLGSVHLFIEGMNPIMN